MYSLKNSSSLLKHVRPLPEHVEASSQTAVEAVRQTATKVSLMQNEPKILQRTRHDLLVNCDPFEAIPGPKMWTKVSGFVQLAARQTTVSVLKWFFRHGYKGLFSMYGPVVKLPGVFGGNIVLISRPQDIAAVYEQEGTFPVRATLDSIDKYRLQRRGQEDFFGSEEWRELREAFHQSSMKEGTKYLESIEDAARQLTNKIRVSRNHQSELGHDLMLEINKWSLECLCLVTFDKSFGFLDNENAVWSSDTARLLKYVSNATKSICKCETGLQLWRIIDTPSSVSLDKACKAIEGIILEHIRQARIQLVKRKREHNDRDLSLLESMLLDERMTLDDVITSVLDILLVGVNTTSSALGFLLYHVAQNPSVQRELFAELKKILPSQKQRLEYHHLHALRYLRACLKESLRLKMPMPVLSRVLQEDVVLSNYRVPRGTCVVMPAQIDRLNETNFEDAQEFRPERWLDTGSSSSFQSLPLCCDPRANLEKRLPEITVWTCAARILRSFQIEYNYEEVNATNTAISFPDRPLKFRFVERQS